MTVLLLVLAAAGLWLVAQPREYTATATVTATATAQLPRATGSDVTQTLAALANSRPVLEDVLAEVGPLRSVAALRREVDAERVAGTVLIRIQVHDTNADYAARAANAIADVLPLHDPTGGKVAFTDAGGAVPPSSPSSPQVALVVLIATGIGVVLAVVVALLRDRTAARIERGEQLEQVTGAPLLTTVARPADPAVVQTDTPGPVADAFRKLRVALEFAGTQAPTRTIVVTPVQPDPAAGWVAVNLAAALAQVQHRVLLIDADFGDGPRPALLSGDGAGLSEVLAGKTCVADAIVTTELADVSVLTLGDRAVGSPAALLEVGFADLLCEFDEFDVVLVLASALTESDDAHVLSVGNAVLMTVPSRLRTREVRREADTLRRMRLRLVGSVLLRTGRKR